MAITNDQYNRLLARTSNLENGHNDIVTAIEAFITLGQMNQLLTLLQQQIDNVQIQVTALENRITAVEEEPLT
jgi:hypothetical protein